MTTASDGERPQDHQETWCDTQRHILPTPPDREDPGCHRVIEYRRLWAMIHRINGRVMISDDKGDTYDWDDILGWTEAARREIRHIPRPRSA